VRACVVCVGGVYVCRGCVVRRKASIGGCGADAAREREGEGVRSGEDGLPGEACRLDSVSARAGLLRGSWRWLSGWATGESTREPGEVVGRGASP
jgi:hypothetical protein